METELNTTQSKEENVDADDPSSEDCGSERGSNVPHGPAGPQIWAGPPADVSLFPHLLQHPTTGMLDPFSYRFNYPYQLAYPDYLLEPQYSQYHYLPGPVPAPLDSSQHSSASAPWFTSEPFLCSMMPVDLHASVAGICVPQQVMDHQQFQDGLTEAPQPVVCNVSGGRPVVLVNPCDPGPVFFSLESAAAQRGDHHTQGKASFVQDVLRTPSQQTACPLYEFGDHTDNMQPPAPPARTVGARKPCHCTRSQCLKLYCECFANGVMCSNCDCSDCHNNGEHETKRHKAIQSCLGRNPEAFKPKIAGGKSGKVKGWHNKGCNCKRSGCLKNYCECYEANIMCSSSCKCVGCRNYDGGSQTCPNEEAVSAEHKLAVPVITQGVVEAVCGILLSEAERKAKSPAEAERRILEEFGRCLAQIINTTTD